MATRKINRPTRTVKRAVSPSKSVVVEEVVEEVVVTSGNNDLSISKGRAVLLVVLILLLLTLFWKRTNTWPIAAFVNGKPVTRFDLNQELYKQGGQQVLDGMITESLISSEIEKQNVKASDEEIDARINEIKESLGENFDSALAAQGLTIEQLKSQINTQLSLEKMLSDQATVSASEIDTLAKETGDKAEAEKMLKQQKLQELISAWVEDLRAKAKITIVGQK